MDFLVTIALGNAVAADLAPCRQMAKRGDQALEFQHVRILVVEFRRLGVRAMLQDARILTGIHRKAMIVVGHIELAAFLVKDKFQLAAPGPPRNGRGVPGSELFRGAHA